MIGLIPQIALAAIIAVAHAAAEPAGTLTLACKGESTLTMIGADASPQEPVSMGIIVSFKEETVGWVHSYGTVEGFHGIRAQILLLDETQVQFGGDDDDLGSIRGVIDRVTNDTNASYRSKTWSMKYSLNCKPTQRMF
jgi:hypothetical protein